MAMVVPEDLASDLARRRRDPDPEGGGGARAGAHAPSLEGGRGDARDDANGALGGEPSIFFTHAQVLPACLPACLSPFCLPACLATRHDCQPRRPPASPAPAVGAPEQQGTTAPP